MLIHMTHRHTHTESRDPQKWWGAWEADRAVSGGMGVVVGESWPRTVLENIAMLHRLLSVLWEAVMAGDSRKRWRWWG